MDNGAIGQPLLNLTVNKPLALEAVEFEQIDDNTYELNWERFAEESEHPIEYLIFGSNSLDFIPSVYCDIKSMRLSMASSLKKSRTRI